MSEPIVIFDDGLKSCCGARFLARFGNCADFEGGRTAEKWNGKAGHERLEKELRYKVKMWGGQAFLVAILNSEQWNNVGKIFTDVGFKVVACGWSGGHCSKLRLLAYINNEEDVEKDNAKKKAVGKSKRKTGVALF